MSKFLNILTSAFRAKILPIFTRLKLWFSPTFIKTKVFARIKNFFVKILDVKPRHKRDYYPVFKWLVSRRLAYALVIAVGLISAIAIINSLPEDFSGDEKSAIDTYEYRSIPLKFKTGKVRILGNGGYVAYEGEVSDGAANGKGTLFASDGSTVYTGDFANNMYNGKGTFYYPNGNPKYIGEFKDNIFNGNGIFFRENGTTEYSGTVDRGIRSGDGTLYNSAGAEIYKGKFIADKISFSDFVARPTSKVSELYGGELEIYESQDEYCVVMSEIDAAYSVNDGANTLESEWTVKKVYIMSDSVILDGKEYKNISDIKNVMGEPLYFGATDIDLPEAVCRNKVSAKKPDKITSVSLEATEGLERVYSVTKYDDIFEIYIYTFEKDGILYTFYFSGAGESGFYMYAIEKA